MTGQGVSKLRVRALLRHLADQVQLSVATTHFGELKALKYDDSRFENASVEFDEVSLRPTYRLLWGIPGRSNALAVARRLGLSEAVLGGAEQLLDEQGTSSVNTVISGLEEQRQRQQEAAEEAAAFLQPQLPGQKPRGVPVDAIYARGFVRLEVNLAGSGSYLLQAEEVYLDFARELEDCIGASAPTALSRLGELPELLQRVLARDERERVRARERVHRVCV